jgi:NADH-quinone oxidoreductase subunit M
MPWLMILFAFPLVASLTAFSSFFLKGKILKRFSLILSLVPLGILLYTHHVIVGSFIQYDWFPQLSIQFYLSVDTISLIFLYLMAIIVPFSILAVQTENLTSPHLFYGLILLLQALLIGFFSARDLVLFTLFWEAMLLPLYFIISIWGKFNRQKAAMQFLIYMIAGSTLMVAAVLGLYTTTAEGSFNLDLLTKTASSSPYAVWIFAIFILAFAVKTPLFPFHAWLPEAYYEAPTGGTILLSGILSKAGIYGVIRIGMGLFPELMIESGPFLLGLAIVGVFYGGLNAWVQADFKRLIAYSSLSHVNFILAGLFVGSQVAHTGALLQAFNHGITITALFLVSGWLEERLHSTSIETASGLAKYMPHLCWLTLIFVISSVAVPGTNNFIGELLILFGLFGKEPWQAAILGLSIILSVIYMLRFMQKMYFEKPSIFQNQWVDIKVREMAIAFPLVAIILWIGIYPAPFLKTIERSINQVIVDTKVE